jgi:tetratricopeptide (TPR) repeat protein
MLEDSLAWLEVERTSLIAAIHAAANHGFHRIVWQLCDALWSFFFLRSYWADARDTHRAGLAAARKARDRRAEAWMMTSIGIACSELEEFDDMLPLHYLSLAISRDVGDLEGEARGLCGLGRTYIRLGELEEAVQCLERSLAICRQIRYPHREGTTLHHLGMAYCNLGRFEEAIACLLLAATVFDHLLADLGDDGSAALFGHDASRGWVQASAVEVPDRKPASLRSRRMRCLISSRDNGLRESMRCRVSARRRAGSSRSGAVGYPSDLSVRSRPQRSRPSSVATAESDWPWPMQTTA